MMRCSNCYDEGGENEGSTPDALFFSLKVGDFNRRDLTRDKEEEFD